MKSESPRKSGLRPDLAMAACLTGLAVLLYLPIVKLYWLYDDAFHLGYILGHTPLEYLFSPSDWRELPFKMFTPLQMISYELDLAIFGLSSSGFYGHQILITCFALVSLYAAFRFWIEPWRSAIAVVIFVMGSVSLEWVHLLMLRHYSEGLILACLATIAFVLAVKRESRGWSWLSAAIYLGACLCKEVFVPLPFLLFLLPEHSMGSRLKLLRGHALVFVTYLAWRYAMLGTLLGGYGWSVRPEDWTGVIAALPVKLWTVLFGAAPFAGAVFIFVFLASTVVLTIRSRAVLGRIALAALLAVGPIIPVSTVLERRYTVLLWLLMVVVIALASQQLESRRRGIAALMMLLALGASVRLYAIERSKMFSLLEQMSAEGRGLRSMSEGDVLRHPATPPAAMNALRMLSERSLGARPGVRWFYDDFYLCDPLQEAGAVRSISPSERFWQYDASSDAIEEITSRIPQLADRHCNVIRWNVPLGGEFAFDGDALQWTLGPYERGTYSFVLDGGMQKYEMPREGGFQLGPIETLSLRLRYDSPEGWLTYSPQITLDFRERGQARWERR